MAICCQTILGLDGPAQHLLPLLPSCWLPFLGSFNTDSTHVWKTQGKEEIGVCGAHRRWGFEGGFRVCFPARLSYDSDYIWVRG